MKHAPRCGPKLRGLLRIGHVASSLLTSSPTANMWGDTRVLNASDRVAGEDTFVFNAGETGFNTIHDFNIGGVNDEILLVGIDNDDVDVISTVTGVTSIVVSGGATAGGQTILVMNSGAPLSLDDIDFA